MLRLKNYFVAFHPYFHVQTAVRQRSHIPRHIQQRSHFQRRRDAQNLENRLDHRELVVGRTWKLAPSVRRGGGQAVHRGSVRVAHHVSTAKQKAEQW